MTATAAARAAVDPRPARGTTGRRAVQVVLFLGGLLALGLLAGGRAEAQERPEPGGLTASVADAVPEDAVRGSTVGEGAVSEDLARTPVEPPVRRVADEVMDPVADEADQVVDPVADQVVEPVADRAAQHRPTQHLSVQGRPTPHRPAQPETARKATAALSASAEPATEPVASVTPVVGGAGDAVDGIAGEVRPLVASLPGLPPLLSVLPELPVPGGDPDAPGAPAAPVPGTGRGAEGSTTPGGTGADASAEHAAGQGRSAGAPGLAPTVPERSGTPDAGHAQLSAPTPALPPTRDRAPFAPCGNLVRTVVADAQGPRGGDLHAAPVPGGPYAALVRGAGLPATAAPITDRSGEILEFPG
ncbi:hypothetical protein ACFY72_07345 [Streptomyces globisporus]|uniref:hypothetical protein n=1 Tax=Streptomyces albovinaceus subgroup TaxID=1482558 RepID=UPI0011808D7E|nr:hypothetical protein [Streptomyces albovinaceus]WSU81401.1 hypothetical protein OG215_12480 [Streptomyces globisporus]